MTDITVLNGKFEKSGSLATDINLDADVVSVSAVHQIVKATLAGRRQGNAHTKTRGHVSGGLAPPPDT